MVLIVCGALLADSQPSPHDPSKMLKAVRMKDATFSTFVSDGSGGGGRDGEGWIVLFYMPWCGYCKDVLPVWDRLADELRGEFSVGKVDLEAETAIKFRFRHKVKGFPTMMFIKDGVMTAYAGNRDMNNLKMFARGGWKEGGNDASAPLPPDPALWTLPEKAIAYIHDFVLEIMSGYSSIWHAHQKEFLAAISTAFSLGGIFGFLVKAFIDTVLLPPLPPRAARPRPKMPQPRANSPANTAGRPPHPALTKRD